MSLVDPGGFEAVSILIVVYLAYSWLFARFGRL